MMHKFHLEQNGVCRARYAPPAACVVIANYPSAMANSNIASGTWLRRTSAWRANPNWSG